MKKVLVILMLLFAGCSKQEASYQQISMTEAKDMMQQSSDYMIVDVRTVEEYNEALKEKFPKTYISLMEFSKEANAYVNFVLESGVLEDIKKYILVDRLDS